MAVEATSKVFRWSGVGADGNKVKNAQVLAATREQVIVSLSSSGAYPTKVVEQSGLDLSKPIGRTGVKFNSRQRADFARKLYQLLRSGVAVQKAITSIGDGADTETTKMCTKLSEDVLAGQSLAEALAAHPHAFDEVFIAYVSVGEQSGTLLTSLERLAILLAQRAATQTKVRGVMVYPVLVGSFITLLATGILVFLVPRFVDIYASFNSELPAATQVMVALSNNMLPIVGADTTDAAMAIPIPFLPFAFNPLSVMSFVLYFFIAWRVFKKTTASNERVNVLLCRIKYRLPLLGKLLFTSAIYRWSSTLSGSLAAGVQATRALEMAAAASTSAWIRSVTPDMIEAVRAGRSIASEMARHPKLFPVNVRTLVSTGEQTGDLPAMLDSVTLVLQEEIDAMVEGMSAKIEVGLLLVLGGVVGTMVIVLYLPILQLASAASSGLG
jgi:type IV pilus assembly protein PilC